MVEYFPIESCLPDLVSALKSIGTAIVQAPPGAGKTTGIPLALLPNASTSKRILMLQPRRVAAQASAARIASLVDEELGQRVGFRIRGKSKISKQTCLEIVTEGILTRLVQTDPALTNYGTIIFDEFHERSLHSDLALSLVKNCRDVFRPDLKLIVMSATLDTATVAKFLDDPPIVISEGRTFPITYHHLATPLKDQKKWEPALTDLIEQAHRDETGDILVFLPGEREIKNQKTMLTSRIGNTDILMLYGAMPLSEQRKIVSKGTGQRRIILATNIAETSLTIPGIRVVVDSGLTRRARFDRGSGMTSLNTERASKAESAQRAGRAGRTAPGIRYALWSIGQSGAAPQHPPLEIETSDLSRLVLELAAWGDPDLAMPTSPPEAAMDNARNLLIALNALDASGKITAAGTDMLSLPVHPRIAHLVTQIGARSARFAALLSARDPFVQSADSNLQARYGALSINRHPNLRATTVHEIRDSEVQIQRLLGAKRESSANAIDSETLAKWAALAYPDRVAKRRNGADAKYLLASGKGAALGRGDPLGNNAYLVITEMTDAVRDARIRLALPISEHTLRETFADKIIETKQCHWSSREQKVIAFQREELGSIVLSEVPWTTAPPEEIAIEMCRGIRTLGLSLSSRALAFQKRVGYARQLDSGLPDFDETRLLSELEVWLLPYLENVRSRVDWQQFDVLPALQSRLTYAQNQQVERLAPMRFQTPEGSAVPVDYSHETPQISVRLQAMLGLKRHPMAGSIPMRVTLLSPANRPLQTTSDLPGFWRSSYADVRKDMRAQYPKHFWPENPETAEPTLRTKRKS